MSTIEVAPGDERPILRPAFDWGTPPRTALLCELCREAELTAAELGNHDGATDMTTMMTTEPTTEPRYSLWIDRADGTYHAIGHFDTWEKASAAAADARKDRFVVRAAAFDLRDGDGRPRDAILKNLTVTITGHSVEVICRPGSDAWTVALAAEIRAAIASALRDEDDRRHVAYCEEMDALRESGWGEECPF
jgi:hypothetical protein